jgi:hypothetical protein
MNIHLSVTVLVLYGFASGASAQGHGGGHGGGHAGGGHSGGGHASGGHAGGGHSGGHAGSHASGGHSSGGQAGSAGRSGTRSATGAHRGHVTAASTASTRATAAARANAEVRGTSGDPVAVGRSQSASGTRIDDGVPPYSRPRDGHEPIGTAVPRASLTQTGSSTTTMLLGGSRSYPLFFGPSTGLRLGTYGFGLYDWGYFDPWYGPVPMASPSVVTPDCEGALRLRVTPNDAQVYVDGQFVGLVDDFDGMFQKLHLTCDAHRIEITADGYEPLVFDARITPDHKTSYQGALRRIQ